MLGQRIAEARKRAGLRQVELAVALGDRYDHSVISRVESGQSGLRIDGLAKAAAELNVSADWLLGLTDDPTPSASRTGSHVASTHGDDSPVDTSAIAEAGAGRATAAEGHRDSHPIAHTRAGYNPDEANDQAGIWNLPIREVSPAAGSGADVFGEEVVGYVPFRKGWLAYHGIDPEQADVVQVSGESMEPTLPDGCSILVDRSRRELQPKRIYVLRNEDGLVVKRVDRNRDGWWVISDNPAWLPVSLTEETDIVGEVRWLARTF